MKMESMYEQLGVSAAVYEYGERIIAELRDRFRLACSCQAFFMAKPYFAWKLPLHP